MQAQQLRQPQFVTEAAIRKEAWDALYVKRAVQQARQDEKTPVDVAAIEREIEGPEYQKWIQDRVEAARAAGWLLSPQQAADIQVQRWLQEGDRVRFIGPSRMEKSPTTGRLVMRPTGQTGTVTSVTKNAWGQVTQFVVMPDIDRKTREAADAGMTIEVLTLTTNKWIEFERIV